MAGAMKASLTLELIDKISAPAKAAAQSLRNIGAEAKKATQDAVSTNVETLKKAGDAAAEKARRTGEIAKAVARKAVEDAGKAADKAQAAATKPAGDLKDRSKTTGEAPIAAAKPDEAKKADRSDAKAKAKAGDLKDRSRTTGEAPIAAVKPDEAKKADRSDAKAKAGDLKDHFKTTGEAPIAAAKPDEAKKADRSDAKAKAKAGDLNGEAPIAAAKPDEAKKADQSDAKAKAKAGDLKDHFKTTGEAPVAAAKPDEAKKVDQPDAMAKQAKAEDKKTEAKGSETPAPKSKPTALADLKAGAGMAAGLAGDLVGKAAKQARTHLQTTVADKVSAELGGIASDFIAKRAASLMEPVRGHLNQIREQYPILAPLVDKVGGKVEHVAALATGAAQNLASKAVSSVATKAGLMAAGLVGLPGLAVGAGLAVLTQWSKVKSGAGAIFDALPAPAQKAMTKVGETLAKTPLGTAAKAFDQFGNYVEGVFKTLVNGGPNQMQKLREQLVDQPKQWASDMVSNIGQAASGMWDQFKTSPSATIMKGLDRAGDMMKAIPKALGNIGVDLAESLTGMDLSGVRGKVNEVVDAFFGIPNKLSTLGGEIIHKISDGDWVGAATTLASGFQNILLGIPKSLGGLANELIAVFTGVNLADKAQQIANDFVTKVQEIPGRLSGLVEEIKGAFKIDLGEAGVAAITSLLQGMKRAWSEIVQWTEGKIASLKSMFSFSIATPTISAAPSPQRPATGGGGLLSGGGLRGGAPPGRAQGGPVRAGGLYKVGEHGEELFVPGQDGSIVNAADTRRILSPAMLPPSAPYASLAEGGGIGGGRLALDLRGGAPATAPRGPVTQTFHVAIHAAPSEDPETTARRFWAEAERQARGGLYDGGAA